MNDKMIELELRAEISPDVVENIKRRLRKLGNPGSHTKRFSVMYFGMMDKKNIDIRVRVTNGDCEVVIKVGSYGAPDRIEITQLISMEQFIGFVKIFSQFGFTAKVGERETYNYLFPNDITISLVIAGTIAYIELEKMSFPQDVNNNTNELKIIASQLNLNLLNSERQFDELCKRLDEKIDRSFSGSMKDYKIIKKILKEQMKLKSG